MKKLFLFSLICISFLGFSQEAQVVHLHLKNNDLIKGYLLESHADDSVVIKSLSLDTIIISFQSIRSLDSRNEKLQTGFDNYLKNQKGKTNNSENGFQSVFLKDINIGFGAGISYGGLGFRLQQKFGNNVGFAWNIGVGYNKYRRWNYPIHPDDSDYIFEEDVFINFGLKVFFKKYFYVSTSLLQFPPNSLELQGQVCLLFGCDYYVTPNLGIDLGFGFYTNDDFDHLIYGSQFSFNAGVFYKLFNPIKKEQQ